MKKQIEDTIILVCGNLPDNHTEYVSKIKKDFANVCDIKFISWNTFSYKNRPSSEIKQFDRKKYLNEISLYSEAIKYFKLDRFYKVIIKIPWDLDYDKNFIDHLKYSIEKVKDTKKPICYSGNNQAKEKKLIPYMAQHVVIHHIENFDYNLVNKLNEEKKLEEAEIGWYMILCLPYNIAPLECWEGYIKTTSEYTSNNVLINEIYNDKNLKQTVERITKAPKYRIVDKPLKVCILFTGKVPAPGVANVEKNIQTIRNALPKADIFCTTWSTEKRALSYINRYYLEPTINYNPGRDLVKKYLKAYRQFKKLNFSKEFLTPEIIKHFEFSDDITTEMAKIRMENTISKRNSFSHNVKQYLSYAMAYNDFITQDYDIVIRARYDGVMQPIFYENIQSLIHECYIDKIPYGFYHFTEKIIDILKPEIPQEDKYIYDHFPENDAMRDFCIIHRADMFDPQHVIDLWENKKLKNAEQGWWQILAKPYSGRHRQFKGYLKLENQVIREIYTLEKYKHIDPMTDNLAIIDRTYEHAINAVSGKN